MSFPGWRRPGSDFGAARSDFQTLPLSVDIDLATARATGAGLRLDINGNFLYVDQKEASGVARVIFQDDQSAGATRLTLYPGTIARIPFTRLTIENDAQPGHVMRLVYGVDVDLEPAPSNSTPISVINGEVQRVLSGQAFVASVGSGPVAATFSHSQLWNPAGSGLRAVVTAVHAWRASAGSMILLAQTAALATNTGSPLNKLLAAAVSTLEARREDNAVLQGLGLLNVNVDGVNTMQFPFTEPFVVLPGNGLGIASATVNVQMRGGFNFYVEADT